MQFMDQGWAALLGAVLGGLIAISLQVVQISVQHRAERKQASESRLAEYLAGTHAAVLAISSVARAPKASREELERGLVWPLLDRVNTALTRIELLEPDRIRAATHSLDAAVVDLARKARAFEGSREAWHDLRAKTMDSPVTEMKLAARVALGNLS